VSPLHVEGLDRGYFAIHIGTSPDKTDQALAAIRQQFKRLRDERVPDEELDRAKRYLIGTHWLGLETNIAVAEHMALHELYGLGYDEYRKYPERIEAVTARDLQRVARKYFLLNSPVISIVRPQPENAAQPDVAGNP